MSSRRRRVVGERVGAVLDDDKVLEASFHRYWSPPLDWHEPLGVLNAESIFHLAVVDGVNRPCGWLVGTLKGTVTALLAQEALALVQRDLRLRAGVFAVAFFKAVRARLLPLRPRRSTN